jgi:hypothetical protein
MDTKPTSLEEVKNNKEWVKLNPKKLGQFKEILGVLARYYGVFSPEKSKCQLFREKFSTAKGGQVYLRKFGGYEYLVFAKLGEEQETWVHVDGIAEERQTLEARGITDHPVFKITCMVDLYGEKKSKKQTLRKVA